MQEELNKLRIDKSAKAKRKAPSRWPWVAGVLVLVGLGAAYLWQAKYGAGSAVEVATLSVRIPEGAVSEADLVRLNATGYVIAAAKIEVAGKVVGRVREIKVDRGDRVEAGQVLVRLEDEEYQARYMQQLGILQASKARLAELEAGNRVEEVAKAKADLDAAIVDRENAEINVLRYRELIAQKAISRQTLDDGEADLRSKAARVESVRQSYNLMKAGARKEQIDAQRANVIQMEGGLKLAQVDLDNTLIRSPVAGTILARNVEVGEFVTTGFVGEAGAKGFVVSLADLNDLRVELDVSQDNIAKASLGQPCWITTDAYPDRKYEGTVDLISPEANRQKATVQVRVKVLTPDGLLKPDMNATVSFLDPAKYAAYKSGATSQAVSRPVLRVPSSAVRDGKVFVVEEGKAVQRSVVVGPVVEGQTEIRKGLIGGEDLVIDPPATLKNEDKVKIRK
jgi:HlyD family secretion protein